MSIKKLLGAFIMITKKRSCLLGTLLMIIGLGRISMPTDVSAQSIDDIHFMVQEFPPFHYEENGQLKGIGVDILVLMFKVLDSKLTREDIKIVPWARAYHTVINEPNTCLFTVVRSPKRKKLFKWIGPLSPTVAAIIAKKERNITINSVEDLKKYRIGVTRNAFDHSELKKKGIIDNLEPVTDSSLNIKKLNKGRIELASFEENVAKWQFKKQGLNPDDFETVYILAEGKLFYAFNVGTPDLLIEQLQRVFNEVKEKEYKSILDSY